MPYECSAVQQDIINQQTVPITQFYREVFLGYTPYLADISNQISSLIVQ